jgi:hypothetical protein
MIVDCHHEASQGELGLDYALAEGSGDFGCAIVSEASGLDPYIDCGARLLALAARETLRIARVADLDAETFGAYTSGKALTSMALFPLLQCEAFDATLLVAWVHRFQLTGYFWGNGFFVHRQNGHVRVVRIERVEQDNLCPYRDREAAPIKHVYDCILEGRNESGQERPQAAGKPVAIKAHVRSGDAVAVFSSGLEQFTCNGEAVEWRDLLPKLLPPREEVQNPLQDTLQRRLLAIKQDRAMAQRGSFAAATIKV